MTFFFFNDTATTEIYTLSLHDALPISWGYRDGASCSLARLSAMCGLDVRSLRKALAALEDHGTLRSRSVQADVVRFQDRKSTRLNSSHANISYAVFCLKKKKSTNHTLN